MTSNYKPNLLSCVTRNFKSGEQTLYIDEFTNEPADGIYLDHFENEKVEEEKEFKNGRANGCHRKWWPDGKLRALDHLRDGLLDGESIRWHFNSQMATKSHWAAGEQNGTFESWWENGNPRCTQKWEKGSLIEETYFHEDGTKVSTAC